MYVPAYLGMCRTAADYRAFAVMALQRAQRCHDGVSAAYWRQQSAKAYARAKALDTGASA